MVVIYNRFLKPIVADAAVVSKCHLSALYTHEKGRLFAQLVDLLQFYECFEIDDHVGTQLSDDDILLAHYSRLQAFQLFAFKQIPKVLLLAILIKLSFGTKISMHCIYCLVLLFLLLLAARPCTLQRWGNSEAC